jgi:hypothetical protein
MFQHNLHLKTQRMSRQMFIHQLLQIIIHLGLNHNVVLEAFRHLRITADLLQQLNRIMERHNQLIQL